MASVPAAHANSGWALPHGTVPDVQLLHTTKCRFAKLTQIFIHLWFGATLRTHGSCTDGSDTPQACWIFHVCQLTMVLRVFVVLLALLPDDTFSWITSGCARL